jgi:hypothetical protein
LPSFFQMSVDVVVPPTVWVKMSGSMLPPLPGWQMVGLDELSTKGPLGLLEVAWPMHWSP